MAKHAPPATNNFYRAWRSPKKVLMQKSQKFCADFKYVNLKIELLQIFEKKSFSSLFLMRKPLSSDQKWFLRPYFPLIGGIFVLKSGLRFLFRALEVPIQKVRKRSFLRWKRVFSSLSGKSSSISSDSNIAGQLVHDHSYFLTCPSDSSVDESQDDLKFACEPPCPAKFKTRYHLDRHKSGTTCFHKLPFLCDLCGKRFITEESKASHYNKGRCVKATES